MISFSAKVETRRLITALSLGITGLETRIDLGLQRTAIETGRELKNEAPKAFSQLANSIHHEQTGHLEYTVSPHVAYAEHVVQGSLGGGAVPFQVLYDWVKVKRLQPNVPGWDLTDLTWAIQKKILQKGTPKQPFIQDVAESGFVDKLLNQYVNEEIDQALAEAGL